MPLPSRMYLCGKLDSFNRPPSLAPELEARDAFSGSSTVPAESVAAQFRSPSQPRARRLAALLLAARTAPGFLGTEPFELLLARERSPIASQGMPLIPDFGLRVSDLPVAAAGPPAIKEASQLQELAEANTSEPHAVLFCVPPEICKNFVKDGRFSCSTK